MRSLKRLVALGAAAVITLMATGCDQFEQVGAHGRIGVIYLNAEGFYAGVKQGLTSSIDSSGRSPQLIQTNIQSDASKESTFVDTISSAQANALIISPASDTASIPAVKLAHENGVPVVCYNTCVTDEAIEKYVSAYILGDPTEFGAASGRQMAEHFKEEGIEEPEVAILNCEQFEVCIERRKGFEAALMERVPGAKIVANQQGLTLDEAVERTEQIITANPDVDAIYGEAGSQMLGAVRGVKARGLEGQTVVFGGDMSTQAAQLLHSNSILKGVADISGIKVGELAAKATLDILRGNEPDEIVVPAPIDEYDSPEAGSDWLDLHPDGIP